MNNHIKKSNNLPDNWHGLYLSRFFFEYMWLCVWLCHLRHKIKINNVKHPHDIMLDLLISSLLRVCVFAFSHVRLCDPMDSSGPWHFSGKDLEWVAIFLLQEIPTTQGLSTCLLPILHRQANPLPLAPRKPILTGIQAIHQDALVAMVYKLSSSVTTKCCSAAACCLGICRDSKWQMYHGHEMVILCWYG